VTAYGLIVIFSRRHNDWVRRRFPDSETVILSDKAPAIKNTEENITDILINDLAAQELLYHYSSLPLLLLE
jgi:hypothetical protein